MRTSTLLLALLGATVLLAPVSRTDAADLTPEWLSSLEWRSIGPANMMGRITALAMSQQDPCVWWAATASGGLIKTVNNGVSFEHQFDRERTVSIGDVAVAPSDHAIVWVGTGESNPRNSVSWGDGVYKSTDGGATWKNMGLKESYQVGRIAIHPENPDVVYVGALGRLWGPNEERGLYKTTDGGENWERLLYVDDKTGVIDVQMSPTDPDTLLVATYERQRDGFDTNDPAKRFGPGSAIWRTTDGGESFERVSEGLPSCNLGRIGMDFHRADPNIVFALVESEKIGTEPEDAAYGGLTGEDADVGARLTAITEYGPADQAGLRTGDIVIRMEEDTVHSYRELQRLIRMRKAGDTVAIEVSRDRKTVEVELTFEQRPEQQEDAEQPRARRQRGARSPFPGRLGGQNENLQDEQGPEGKEFGGLYRSADGGVTWTRVNSLNPRPMYFSQVRVDPSDPNYVYVLGVSMYMSKDGGTTFESGVHRNAHVDHHALWIDPRDGRHLILGNDGGVYVSYDRTERWDHYNHVAIGQFYHVTTGPRRNYMVYGGLQDNGSWGGPSRTRDGRGPINEDWFRVGGGDGFLCAVDPEDPDQIYIESQNGGLGRLNIRTGESSFMRPRAPRGTRYRFNWRTPFLLSNHNSQIYYTAGNHVFRSLRKGNNLQAISPEITNTDRGSATALAESPREEGVLYVGTDDGALWMTKDDGKSWTNLYASDAEAAPEAPAEGDAPAADEAGPRRAPAADATPERGGRGGRGGGAAGGRMLEMLRQADRNGDGTIARDEVPEQMTRFFDRIDANGDGTIDKSEVEALAARLGGAGPERTADADAPAEPRRERARGSGSPIAAAARAAQQAAAAADDPISGTWKGAAEMEGAPADQGGFTLVLTLGPDGVVTGTLTSPMNDGPIDPGAYDAAQKTLRFTFGTEQFDLNVSGRIIAENTMTGTIEVGDGAFQIEFTAERTDRPATAVANAAGAPTAGDATGPAAANTIASLMPDPRWVSSLEASRFENGRVYVTFDGHRSDDDAPHAFVSDDYGATWTSLTDNLPDHAGSTRVLREDITNAEVLYLGCEFSAWVSIDRGATWTSLNTNLPTVAIHEIAQHPTAGEIVAATHGRSLWVLDVTPLRQMTEKTLVTKATLFTPNPTRYWRNVRPRGGTLVRFTGSNPRDDAAIYYALTENARQAKITITDVSGDVLHEVDGATGPGLHRVTWNLRRRPANQAGGGQARFRRGGPRVEPGRYTVALEVDGMRLTQQLQVQGDPDYPEAVLWGEEYDEMMAELEKVMEPED